MKKILYLLILVTLSNLSFSQTTNTNPTNLKCYTPEQVNQIYLGLQQGNYLKERVKKAESSLENAKEIIKTQEDIVIRYKNTVSSQEKILETERYKNSKDLELKQLEKEKIERDLSAELKRTKSEKKKNFWKGLGVGTGLGAIGVLTTLFILK